jgi:Holliday junction DNA helicase RuvA
MYHSLRGRVTGRRGTTIHLSTGGIEWAIEVSRQSFEHILSREGEEVRIFTYLHHREDSMLLFGFSEEQEREIFLELLRVSGIGPRQALKILSGIRAEELVSYIESEDAEALSRLPGIGKKTAGKIILALRGSLTPSTEEETRPEYDELVNALVDMGFDRKGAQKAVSEVTNAEDFATIPENEREHEVFRRAIVALSSE